jgi:HlyD family secretion protein
MKLIKFIAISIVLIILIGSSACSVGKQTSAQVQTTITKGDITVKVNGTGKATYANDIKLAFDTPGKVETLTVKKGDQVTKGAVLAKLDTGDLELAVSQAKVTAAQTKKALFQAEIAVTQAEIAATQAKINLSQSQSAKTQAEAAVTAAQFNLDKIQAVGDIKDKIMDIQISISTAKENRRLASASGDTNALSFLNQHLDELNAELDRRNSDLLKLLAKDEYSNVAPYEVMIYNPAAQTYTLDGQIYNRLVVEDIQIKQRQLQIAQAGVEQASETIVLANQQIEQAKQNIQLAKQTVEQTQLSMEQANKALEVAQNQLAHATIAAPFDGVVTALDIKQGDYILTPGLSAGTPIYMVDPKSLEISTRIDEIDIAGVRSGQKAVINLEALPNYQFEGIVTAISTIPVTGSSTSGVVEYEVTIDFDGAPPEQVKTGMSATVDIITYEKKGVVLVPNKSIKQNNQAQKTVDVSVNQKIQEQPVVLGLTDGTQSEVLSGLNEGDIVIKYP